ncbi:MAG: PIG-L family deacetylase [Candidatus Omnitrophica bacterium]|nr:PIG-L family deacetylase [Candidatus Omnitrophota bacterium]MBI2173952.1 PIG-L family deacetylase [Candidatus Omnitrophota bacterium]
MKIVVVAAHPDDEVLGCGGTIARESAKHEVYIVILGEGIQARYNRPHSVSRKSQAALEAQARAAAKILGAASIRFERLPDNQFDTVPLLTIVKRLESYFQKLKPEVIYTHHPGDLNIDHVLTHRAVLTASRPIKGSSVRDVLAFEVPSSSEWAFQRLGEVFRPNIFVDISATLERKLAAMGCYAGEVRVAPHPRSPQILRAIAQRWGSVSALQAAEAFELIRSVRS